AQDRDGGRHDRHRRCDAERARAGGGRLSPGPCHPLPDRARRAPDRGYLAVSLQGRLLAARAGDDVRDRRGRRGAVGHQGQGGGPAALPAAGRCEPRRLHGLWPCQWRDDRGDDRGSGSPCRGRLQGGAAPGRRAGAQIHLWRRQAGPALRAGGRRAADREPVVDREISPLGGAAVREGARSTGLGRPPASRRPPPADPDRGGAAGQGAGAVSPVLAG
ncbi:hypothetical protein QU38_02705, partial [Staphylococcus aureus]